MKINYDREQTIKILHYIFENYLCIIKVDKIKNNYNNQNIFKKINEQFPYFLKNSNELIYIKNNYNEILSHILCKKCNNKNSFKNINQGYNEYCSRKCSLQCNASQRLENTKKTKELRYGDPFFNNSLKTKNTWKNKTEHQIRVMTDKIKNTCMLKYNCDNYRKTDECKEKIKQTKLKKYNNKNYNNLEKYKNTCLKRYNKIHFTQTKQYRNLFKNKKWLDKKQNKEFITKKKNNTFNVSKPENECFQLLKQKFSDSLQSYRSNRYPFNCDFYIPSLDLYIECHFSHYHHYEPFDIDNEKHLKELEKLKIKSRKKYNTNNRKNQYDFIIYTWTDLDVRKLKTFKENNLNYKIFYTKKEFEKWLKIV